MEDISCNIYHLNRNKEGVDKLCFASVFKEAYNSTIKVNTITNAFKRSGTYPCNKDAIDPWKLAPANCSVSSYKESTTVSVPVNVPIEPILQVPVESAPDIPSAEECKVTADSSELALKALESQMELKY